MAKILVKNSVTSGSSPAGLSLGEIAVNITDRKIFFGNAVESAVAVYDRNAHVLSFNGLTGAVTFSNYVSSLNGATGAITNVAVTNAAQTFSGLQSFSTGISAASILAQTIGGDEGGQVDFGNPVTNTSLTGGICIDIYQNRMRFFEKGGTARGYYIDLTSGAGGAGTNLVGSGVAGVSSFNGLTGAVIFADYVSSVNGATGAITNVARTNQGNTFSVLQVMSAGITSTGLYITSGSTFDSTIAATSTTNTVDVVATTDGAGLRIAQATTGSSARVGGIRLGRSTSHGSNVYLEGYVGTFRVYNGLSGTVASAGTKMLELSPSGGAIFGIPIAGATFTSTDGRITLQKSSYVGSDSGTVRIVGADALATQYNSDIRANASAAADTTHTLPAVTGTLLNTASSYVVSVNGSTGAVTNVARTNEGNTFTARQVMNSGITSANIYVSSGATFASAVVSDGGYRITSNAINAQTDSYSLQESDNGKIITVNAGTVKTITVPSGLSVGFNCTVMRIGTGRVTFSASGTTINSIDGLLEIASQHGAASLLCYASNTFNLSGNLA